MATAAPESPDKAAACQARGPRGPLYGHWPLLDRLAGYWFSGAPQARPPEGLAD